MGRLLPSLMFLVAMFASTLADAQFTPSGPYDACIAAANFFGTDKRPCLVIRPPAPAPIHKAMPPAKDYAYQLSRNDPIRLGVSSAGTLNLELADGKQVTCPAALLSGGHLLTSAYCGARMAQGSAADDPVVRAEVGLGSSGHAAKGVVRLAVLSVPLARPMVSSGGSGLAIVQVASDGSPLSPVRLPARVPAQGNGLLVYDGKTAKLRKGCEVDTSLNEDRSLYSYACPGTSGEPVPFGALLFSADDLALVGMTTNASADGTARFLSVRAFATTSDVGRLLAADSRRVVACFNSGGGHWTIRQMFDCSGAWVTPGALLRCTLDVKCPTIADTPVGRAELASILGGDPQTAVDRVLTIDVQSMPRMPATASIDRCNSSTSDPAGFRNCVLDASTAPEYRDLQTCIMNNTGVDRAKCITSRLNDTPVEKVITCLGGSPTDSASIVKCLGDAKASGTLDQMRVCAGQQANGQGVAGCLFAAAPSAQGAIAKCLADPTHKDKTSCLELASPDYARAKKVIDCLHGVSGQGLSAASSCVATQLPGDSGRIAGCLANPDEETAATCLLPQKPEVIAAEQVYRCASAGRDVASLFENCTQGLGLDPKAQQALACTARAGTDTTELLGCAAGAALPPEAARLVGCAGTTEGPTDFAICASGPLMNEEWRIAAECAVESGGQPYATAGCAATRLTVRELTKCFKGQVGKDCFGPNNTIVKTLSSAFDDVVHGPGKNNDVVKALAGINEGIERISPAAAAFIERPLGSDQALIPKARDDLLNGLGIGGTGRKMIENPTQPWKWF